MNWWNSEKSGWRIQSHKTMQRSIPTYPSWGHCFIWLDCIPPFQFPLVHRHGWLFRLYRSVVQPWSWMRNNHSRRRWRTLRGMEDSLRKTLFVCVLDGNFWVQLWWEKHQFLDFFPSVDWVITYDTGVGTLRSIKIVENGSDSARRG